MSSNETAASTVSHPAARLIVLGDRSQARVIETYVAATDAVLSHQCGHRGVRRRRRGPGSLQGAAGERAGVPSRDHARARDPQRELLVALVLAWRPVRSQRRAGHARRRRAEVTLNGLYLADGDRLVDNHTTIDHARPHCPSHEVYKGILGGRAKAVFNGKIIVRRDAQKTDAKQTNRAAAVRRRADQPKPQLEIFADDVKCTHGAAIGQLDEDALFYLRARGLTYYEARDMLIHAFAGRFSSA